MSDLIDRLKVKPSLYEGEKINHLLRRLGVERVEAASEITRLRGENERLRESIEAASQACEDRADALDEMGVELECCVGTAKNCAADVAAALEPSND